MFYRNEILIIIKLISNDDCLKKVEFFWALALEKTQIRHDRPPPSSRILCSSLLFVDDLFLVCFQERFCTSYSRCSSLDICRFTYVFSCSLSCSFHRILHILVSSLTFLRVFLDSLYVFYVLFVCFFFGCSVSFFSGIFACELIRNCKTLKITVQLQPHKFDFVLKTRVANYLLTRLHIYKPT